MALVEVEHPKTLELYRMERSDYAKKKARRNSKGEMVTYQDDGFQIVRYADGTPFEEEAPATASTSNASETKADAKSEAKK